MVLWDRIFVEVAAEFPDVQTNRMNVDAMSMLLIQRPQELDVIVASNMFGDILSDEAAAVTGSIGLAPSGNINPEREFPSMFEPIHGSAPDIAGTGIANPIGAILAGAMLLRFVGGGEVAVGEHPVSPGPRESPQARACRAADLIEAAMAAVLRRGEVRTPDLDGRSSTAQVGDAVCAALGR